MPACPSCQQNIPVGRRNCPLCSASLEAPCPFCGFVLPGLFTRCPRCRERLADSVSTPSVAPAQVSAPDAPPTPEPARQPVGLAVPPPLVPVATPGVRVVATGAHGAVRPATPPPLPAELPTADSEAPAPPVRLTGSSAAVAAPVRLTGSSPALAPPARLTGSTPVPRLTGSSAAVPAPARMTGSSAAVAPPVRMTGSSPVVAPSGSAPLPEAPPAPELPPSPALTTDLPLPARPVVRPVPGDPMIGQVVDGRFTVLKKLGAGGMGTVYLARQDSVDREVALKVLLPSVADTPDQVARFMTEARTASQLRSPNTVTVFDFGKTPDGRLYLAMELLVGEPLADVMKDEGSLPWARAAHICIQVLGSLHEAHQKGFLHRDIKPDNVIVGELDGIPDFAKVLDFGIARSIGEGAKRLTATGIVLGTPRYMSPEQATGSEMDHRSDLYSLGVMLFEMLAGVPPFDAETPLPLLLMHVTEPVPDLFEVAPELEGELPVELKELVEGLMAKSPEQRPASAAEVREILQDILDRETGGRPRSARPRAAEPPRQRTEPPRRRTEEAEPRAPQKKVRTWADLERVSVPPPEPEAELPRRTPPPRARRDEPDPRDEPPRRAARRDDDLEPPRRAPRREEEPEPPRRRTSSHDVEEPRTSRRDDDLEPPRRRTSSQAAVEEPRRPPSGRFPAGELRADLEEEPPRSRTPAPEPVAEPPPARSRPLCTDQDDVPWLADSLGVRLHTSLYEFLFQRVLHALEARLQAPDWQAMLRVFPPEELLEDLRVHAEQLPREAVRLLQRHTGTPPALDEAGLGKRLVKLLRPLGDPWAEVAEALKNLRRAGTVPDEIGEQYRREARNAAAPEERGKSLPLPAGLGLVGLTGWPLDPPFVRGRQGATHPNALLGTYHEELREALEATDLAWAEVYDELVAALTEAGGPTLEGGSLLKKRRERTLRQQERAVDLFNHGDWRKALSVIEAARSQQPEDPAAAALALRIAAAAGLKEEVRGYLPRLEQAFPGDGEVSYARAEGLMLLGKDAEACTLLEQGAAQWPTHRGMRLLLAQLLMQQELFERALKVLNPLVRDYPHLPELVLMQARAHGFLGRKSEALDALHRLERLTPVDAPRATALKSDPAFLCLAEERAFRTMLRAKLDLLQLAETLFPGEDRAFFFGAEVPEAKLATAEEKWLFLQQNESLLFLIDTSLLGRGGEGIAVSDQRLFWKVGFADPEVISLDTIRLDQLKKEDKGVRIGRRIVTFSRQTQLLNPLVQFLTAVARSNG